MARYYRFFYLFELHHQITKTQGVNLLLAQYAIIRHLVPCSRSTEIQGNNFLSNHFSKCMCNNLTLTVLNFTVKCRISRKYMANLK